MTELEHIEIEGFKGLKHVEFEPTDINLITGRNNTGKTSLLEAIGLIYNPGSVRGFDADLEKLININNRSAHIVGEDAEDNRVIRIRNPVGDEAKNFYIEALSQYLRTRVKWRNLKNVGDELSSPEWLVWEPIEDIFKEVSKRTVNEEWNSLSSELEQNCLEIVINGDTFPYVRLGGLQRELLPTAHEHLVSLLRSELENLLEADKEDIKLIESRGEKIIIRKEHQEIHFELSVYIADKDEFFLNETPNGAEKTFIKHDSLNRVKNQSAKEKDALKIDDIGDYIKETNLVDGLKTFTFDYLVFEDEEGEKYDIPYEFMGDGFKSIVGLLWELLDKDNENEIVLIEEPENHMHPGYVSELVHFLIDLARDEDIQFFITTHDHDFIKDFFMDMPEEKREYLEDEFSLVKMDDFGADVLDYEDAEHHLKDLHLDLRGI